jgi:hypothetical protein
MKNERRLKAVAIASGAAVLASAGVARIIEAVAPAKAAKSTPVAAPSARQKRKVAAPTSLLVIKREEGETKTVAQQPRVVYVQAPGSAPAPAAPAPAPAPVTRTS